MQCSTGLMVAKLKRGVVNIGVIHILNHCPQIISQAIAYSISDKNFHKYISIAKSLTREAIFNFFKILETHDRNESATEKNTSDGKEMRILELKIH